VLDKAAEMGAMEVETPIMYDMEHPTLKKYLDRFPARQYQIEADKRNCSCALLRALASSSWAMT